MPLVTDKIREFELVKQDLQEHLAFLGSGFDQSSLHGVKYNRKEKISVGGVEHELAHSFVILYDEASKTLMPCLLNPGKPRNGLTSQKLGQGGFGRVKIAELQNPDGSLTQYAMKIMAGLSPSPEYRVREHEQVAKEVAMATEAGMSKAFFMTNKDKPGFINRPYFYFLQNLIPGQPVLLTHEQPDGSEIYQVQPEIAKSPKHTLDVALKSAQAYKNLHDKNIVHLDIKPENIMYDPKTRELNLIDFGLCQKVGHKLDSPAGTLDYLSPEIKQLQFNPKADVRVTTNMDVYSLGVMFCNDLQLQQFDTTTNNDFTKLMQAMLAADPKARPSMQVVVDSLNVLTARKFPDGLFPATPASPISTSVPLSVTPTQASGTVRVPSSPSPTSSTETKATTLSKPKVDGAGWERCKQCNKAGGDCKICTTGGKIKGAVGTAKLAVKVLKDKLAIAATATGGAIKFAATTMYPERRAPRVPEVTEGKNQDL